MRQKAYAPTGKEIIGSFERVHGCALGEVTREGPGHRAGIEYSGETKIWWDTQRQCLSDSDNQTTDVLWVDEDHNIWVTDELRWRDG